MKHFIQFFIISAVIFSISCAPKQQSTVEEPETYEDIEVQWLIEFARADMRDARAQIVKENMVLSEYQEKIFWPIFNNYQEEFKNIGDERLAIIKEYASNQDFMTSKKADELARRSIDVRTQRLDLMKKYYSKMSKELDSVVAARFLQVENLINLVIDLQIASEVPLMEKDL